MPTSYQAPMRQDNPKQDSKSQTVAVTNSNPIVSDVLAGKSGQVYSITADATLHAAVEQLSDKSIGALVVVDADGALIGILSERDIVRKLAQTPGQTLPQSVESVMTKEVDTCAPGDSTVSVLKRMTAGHYRHMPVVQDGRLLGMLTIGDVVNHRLTQLEREALQLKQLIVG